MILPISIISSFCSCGKMMLGAMSSLQSPENITERYSVFFFFFSPMRINMVLKVVDTDVKA